MLTDESNTSRKWVTDMSWMNHKFVTDMSPINHRWIIDVSQMIYRSVIHESCDSLRMDQIWVVGWIIDRYYTSHRMGYRITDGLQLGYICITKWIIDGSYVTRSEKPYFKVKNIILQEFQNKWKISKILFLRLH